MNFTIGFDIFDLIRQLTNLNLPLSGIAGVIRQFWTFVMNSLKIFGL